MSDALTFLGGTAVGALVVYLTKDKDTRLTVERFVDGVADSLKTFLARLTPEKGGVTSETGAEAVEKAAEEIETTSKPAVKESTETTRAETKSEVPVSEKKTKEKTAIH